jgi:poly-gamma-glutamate synthesis protein (capsule biosynthesis protein)
LPARPPECWTFPRAAFALLLTLTAGPAWAVCPPDGQNFPTLYQDHALFDEAIRRADSYPPSPSPLSGIAVPHHLLVAHLTALGFRAASGARPERIVILSPDHFRRLGRPFAVALQGFDTVFGPVPADRAGGEALLGALGDRAEASCLFGAEHGVHSLLPFVRETFPDVPVIAVGIALRSGEADWTALADALEPLAGENALVVQSTDFSHFLPQAQARARDQEVLNLLAAGSPADLADLHQPDHVDSLGALFVQALLQARRGAEAIVVANENSQTYEEDLVAETTSYMVALWGFPGRNAPPAFGAERVYVAGDTFFGRAMPEALADELSAERVANAVLGVTEGAPLAVNLEGVILPELPPSLPHLTLAMPADVAIPWLKRLNVRGVSLANNHALDLGPAGLAETRAALAASGIPAVGQGEVLSFGKLDLVALTDLDTNADPQTELLTPSVLDALLREGADRAVAGFVHWGREWVTEPSAREEWLIAEMERRGVAVVAGAHPHRAAEDLLLRAGGRTAVAYSLGNFLFDQTTTRGASGALLELTVFPQGTVFSRLRPLPNLFDLARARRAGVPEAD